MINKVFSFVLNLSHINKMLSRSLSADSIQSIIKGQAPGGRPLVLVVTNDVFQQIMKSGHIGADICIPAAVAHIAEQSKVAAAESAASAEQSKVAAAESAASAERAESAQKGLTDIQKQTHHVPQTSFFSSEYFLPSVLSDEIIAKYYNLPIPIYIRPNRDQTSIELRFGGNYRVHIGKEPLEQAAFFANELPDCDLRLSKNYLFTLEQFSLMDDRNLATLIQNLSKQPETTIIIGKVKSRPTHYYFELYPKSVKSKKCKAYLGLVLMAGLSDVASVFAMTLLHAPAGTPEKIQHQLSRKRQFFTMRCLQAALGLLAGYSVIPTADRDDLLPTDFRHYMRQAGSVVAAYLSVSSQGTAGGLQQAISSVNVTTAPSYVFSTVELNSGYAGVLQGCILGGALKYANQTSDNDKEKQARIKILIQFALGGASGVPTWGFTFAMAAPLADRLVGYIVKVRNFQELVNIFKRDELFQSFMDTNYYNKGLIDQVSFDKMLNLAIEEASLVQDES